MRKGLYQAGYIHGGNTHHLLAGTRKILNLQYQAELDSSLGQVRLVPGAGKIKTYQEQAVLIQGLKYILLASGRFSIHQKRLTMKISLMISLKDPLIRCDVFGQVENHFRSS